MCTYARFTDHSPRFLHPQTKTFDLEGFCRGSNPDGENPPPATTSRSPSVRSVTTENSRATPPPGGPPPTSSICTVRPSRQIGECISTDSCESLGGDSTPGLCPGNKDIQVCFTSSFGYDEQKKKISREWREGRRTREYYLADWLSLSLALSFSAVLHLRSL